MLQEDLVLMTVGVPKVSGRTRRSSLAIGTLGASGAASERSHQSAYMDSCTAPPQVSASRLGVARDARFCRIERVVDPHTYASGSILFPTFRVTSRDDQRFGLVIRVHGAERLIGAGSVCSHRGRRPQNVWFWCWLSLAVLPAELMRAVGDGSMPGFSAAV